MSYTEPSADAGQPDVGQAAEGATSGNQPYADYLNRVPEEVRGDIEPIFSDWNKSVNGRFEEHAQFRKQWEPYETFRQYQPDQLSEALQFADAARNNPAALRAWLDQQHGPLAPEQPAQPENPYEYADPTEQRFNQLSQSLEQITSWQRQQEERWAAQEQAQREAQIADTLNAEVQRLKEEKAAGLPEQVREQFDDIIERFGNKYATPGADPRQVVQRAWADFEALSNQLSTAALQAKVDQPQTPLTGGEADLTPEMPTNLRDANRIALEQMRANRAA